MILSKTWQIEREIKMRGIYTIMNNIIFSMKKRLNSLFFRIFLYFLTLLIPIIIIGAISYVYSNHTQKRDFSNMILMNLQSSANTIDIYIQAARETSANFLYDNTVQKYLAPKNIMTLEQKVEVRKIPSILSRNQNIISQFIDNMFVFVDDIIVYTSEGVENFDFFFNKSYKYNRYGCEFWKETLKTEKSIEILDPSIVVRGSSTNGKNVIPFVIVSKVNGHNAAVVLNISADTINKTVTRNSTFPSTGFLILDNQENVIISSSPNYSDSYTIKKITSYFHDHPRKFGELEIASEKMYMTYVLSGNFGWKYYSLTPSFEFKKHAIGILRMTVISCFFLAIIGIILSYIFSIKLFNPIKNIIDILIDNSEDPSDNKTERINKNEWELIGMEINQLMHKSNVYKNKFQQISGEYLDNSFIQLIEGYNLEHEGMLIKVIKDEIGFVNNNYLCCNILFNFTDEFYSEIQDTDRLNIKDGLKKIIWALFKECVSCCYVLEYRNNLFICIVNIDCTEDKALIGNAAEKLLDCFKYDTNYCDICIGIGKTYPGLQSISKSYSDAMTAIENRDKDLKFQVIDSDKLPIINNIYYSFTDENKIINCLKTRDMDNLIRSIDEIFRINKQNAISYKHMGMLFAEVYNTGNRYIAEKGLELKQLITDEEHFIISGSMNCEYEKRMETLKAFYINIIKKCDITPSNKAGSLISMSKEYIENNYCKDIYLENIASEIGVSLNYLSRAFKQKTGINVSDYISLMRIKKAKELLSSTRMNIDEIYKMVGINSRTTFLRLFKKFEGTSPSSYREMSNDAKK